MTNRVLERGVSRSHLYSLPYWSTVAVSLLLRVILAIGGGQLFWPDEGRFDVSRQAARSILKGNVHSALQDLFAGADHLLFKVASTLPALIEQGFNTALWVPALFFALISTGVIAMVGVVSAEAGADEDEVWLATLLAAGTNTLFYYSRHFFPYDLSLLFLLAAVVCGLRGPPGAYRSFRMGVWAGLGFLTYNGYWTLGGCILVVFTLTPWQGLKLLVPRIVGGLLGLGVPVAAALGIGRLLGINLYSSFLAFGGTVIQGDFGVGWRFVPQYLYASERGLLVLWIVATVAAIPYALFAVSGRLRLWLALVASGYAVLVIPSDVLHHFTISGRHVRILAPFLCLLTASVASLAWRDLKRKRSLAVLGLAAFMCIAALNFSEPLGQTFPAEFESLAIQNLRGNLASDLGPYGIVNCWFLHNPTWVASSPDSGTVVLRRNHPYHFLPYLYEGYGETVRGAYRRLDLTMRVVRELPATTLPHGYPGAVELTFRYPPKNPGRLDEPLLATGVPGASDLLFLRYVDPAKRPDLLVVGYDHAGAPVVLSAPFRLDQAAPHRVTLSMGSLYPPVEDPMYGAHPERLLWKQWLYVKVDDHVALNLMADPYPTASAAITFGLNLVHDVYAITWFTGKFTSARPLPMGEFLAGLKKVELPDFASLSAIRPPQVTDFPGALRLTLQLPRVPRAETEPILSAGVQGAGEVLFLKPVPGGEPGLIQLGLDAWGSGSTLSPPINLDRKVTHTLVVSMGSLFPPIGSPYYAGHPEWKNLKHTLFVSVDGRVALDRPFPFSPAGQGSVKVCVNAVGATSVSQRLHAQVLLVEPVPSEIILPQTSVPDASSPETFPKLPEPKALGGFPGALRLTLQLPKVVERPLQEPVLTTGVAGAGDVLFIRSANPAGDPSMIQIGHDHWGSSGALSDPIRIDRDQPHTLVVVMGSLFPPVMTIDPESRPAWLALTRTLFVSLDGKVVLNRRAEFYPARSDTIKLGVNSIGASTARVTLRGRVLALESIPTAEALPLWEGMEARGGRDL